MTALRFVARQELIFGMHVHVGVDDPDKAIHVANGMRVHLAVLLALSANSPFWRADATGLLSARTPIFRTFPRVGIPPHYRDWAHYEREIAFMVESGVMEDYTWLWYDVRPHPKFGTVEVRVCDSQTRVEHTLALAALVQAMVKELCEHYDAGGALGRLPVADARREQVAGGPPRPRRRPRRPALQRARGHQGAGAAPATTACASTPRTSARRRSSRGSTTSSRRGNGAQRQLVVYEANHDLREVMAEIVAATAPTGA